MATTKICNNPFDNLENQICSYANAVDEYHERHSSMVTRIAREMVKE